MPPKTSKSSASSQPLIGPALAAASSASSDASPPREKPASPVLAKELTALKSDIIQAVTSEITRALTAEFHAISREYHSKLQTELQEMKSELLRDNASLRAELGSVVRTVSEVETSLSGLSDEVVGLRAKVESLTSELARVDAKCEDLEARSRRQNIRIIGVPEGDSRFTLSNSTVSELLREALSLEKSPLVDRAHRSLAPRPKPDEPPRPIIVKLHYFEDCVRILREARNRPCITFSDMNLSIYPDLTSKVAKARAAFNTVRRKLRSMDGVKYAGINALTTVTGDRGSSVEIRCSYDSGYETNMKYLCRGECSTLPFGNKDIPVKSGSTAKDQRFSLKDDTAAGVFTVTITDLRPEDAGQYWCVVKRSYRVSPDYTEIQLLVKTDAPKPLVFNSTLTPVSVQIQSTHLPLLAITEFIILYGLVSLLIAAISVGVLVCFCKRRKTRDAETSDGSQADVGGVRDGADYENDPTRNPNSMAVLPIYQSLDPKTNQPDSIYQTLNPNTNQSDSIYQSILQRTSQCPSGGIVEGSSVTLTCRSAANPPVENYTWYKGSALIGHDPTYTIPKFSSEDSGEYRCECSNAEGSAAVTLNLVAGRSIAVYIAVGLSVFGLAALLVVIIWIVKRQKKRARMRQRDYQNVVPAVQNDATNVAPQPKPRPPDRVHYYNRADTVGQSMSIDDTYTALDLQTRSTDEDYTALDPRLTEYNNV
ncbi:uncharacterized protein LOC103022636 [Astyanax mexicanus]|uniref:uncharacterized protein LOC103022636 n=1 Tax=Astyanax mexicanus TaxID=7994 RepID=UPI0020CB41EC|nr:uncharacterized protein LOC103022636 [Astyanax mexicanus]